MNTTRNKYIHCLKELQKLLQGLEFLFKKHILKELGLMFVSVFVEQACYPHPTLGDRVMSVTITKLNLKRLSTHWAML